MLLHLADHLVLLLQRQPLALALLTADRQRGQACRRRWAAAVAAAAGFAVSALQPASVPMPSGSAAECCGTAATPCRAGGQCAGALAWCLRSARPPVASAATTNLRLAPMPPILPARCRRYPAATGCPAAGALLNTVEGEQLLLESTQCERNASHMHAGRRRGSSRQRRHVVLHRPLALSKLASCFTHWRREVLQSAKLTCGSPGGGPRGSSAKLTCGSPGGGPRGSSHVQRQAGAEQQAADGRSKETENCKLSLRAVQSAAQLDRCSRNGEPGQRA